MLICSNVNMLDINYAELFSGVPPQLATLLISMLPVAEIRASIPIAISAYQLSWPTAYFWSVLGGVIPPIIFVFFLDQVTSFLSQHFSFWKRFFEYLFEKTRKKTQAKIEKYGALGVLIIASIPVPILGGGWTAALGAYLFGIQKRKSIPAIVLGTMIMGVIIVLMTIGFKKI